eukprot:CAMPEP_0171454060 /NCGR_PEP_ID=MMETSP0945-20130129/1505_1 /TAXON_ID=109269 /ORGANISM="Vaucheria litorea, Strain CCMP2940" /LENGTH=139 /DNA_ID=CAMNT_0011979023 /DNA_START=260 /DNA_END=679 /DNA_ORIENTATION=-
MKSEGLAPSKSVYAAVVSALNKSHNHKSALKVYNEMRKMGITPYSATSCIAVEAAVKSGDWPFAKVTIEEMVTEGIGLRGRLYEKAAKACLNLGPRDDVYTWLDEIILREKRGRGAPLGRAPNREKNSAYNKWPKKGKT